MILSNVNIGTGPSAGDGSPLRSAFATINNNFQLVTNNVNALTNSVTSVAGRTGNVVLTVNDIVGLSSAYASQANITTANLAMRGYVDQANSIQSAQIVTANIGMKGYVDSVASQSIYGNVNVKAYTQTMGFQNFSNVNVAAYLASQGITGGSYSNVQVATYLPTYSGVVTASNVAVNGNVTAQYFLGNGALLTGIVGGAGNYGNIDVKAFLETDAGPGDGFQRVIEGYYSNIILGDSTKLFSFGNSSKSYFGHDGFANININYARADNSDVRIATNNGAYAWIFDNAGNLTLSGNTFSVNYANGTPVTFSSSSYSNVQVATYLPTYSGVVGASNVFVSGNITANYFIGDGSQLTGVTASVPSQTILPTIQTISIAATSNPFALAGGQGSASVTVANIIPVTEYGVIITDGTSNEKYKTGSLGSIPGTVSLNFTTGLNNLPFTVYAYVTSNAGTFYSNSATGTSGICLLAGTQIALSDGSYKAIEDITYTDKMLSWDFDRGCYAETTAMWIKRGETGSQYNLLSFSDGTTLRTFDQHRIFNKQAGAFTYPMTDETPIGTITVNEHGQEIVLVDKQVIVDTIEYYNVITDYHMNLFSDSVLTSCRFNNIYPIVDMKFVRDTRQLRDRSEFYKIDDRFFHSLRLAEQQFDLDMIEWYVARLESSEITCDLEVII